MSYRCSKCNELCNHKELKHVTHIRPIKYDMHTPRFNREERKKELKYIKSFQGWEIAKENKYCEKCYADIQNTEPSIIDDKFVNFNITMKSVLEDKKQTKFGNRSFDEGKN